jgi:hypothetical protein
MPDSLRSWFHSLCEVTRVMISWEVKNRGKEQRQGSHSLSHNILLTWVVVKSTFLLEGLFASQSVMLVFDALDFGWRDRPVHVSDFWWKKKKKDCNDTQERLSLTFSSLIFLLGIDDKIIMIKSRRQEVVCEWLWVMFLTMTTRLESMTNLYSWASLSITL